MKRFPLFLLLLVLSLACLLTGAPLQGGEGLPSPVGSPPDGGRWDGGEGLAPEVPTEAAPASTPAAASGAALTLEITGNYLLAFHACDTAAAECRDPRSHQVYLAQSDDGKAWSLVPGWQPYPGSVPDVIRRGEVIYIFTPNSVARYNIETQTFDGPLPVTISGLESGFVDPSLILDEQGRLVLFFLKGRIGGDPASCPAGTTTCVQEFGSATEVEGSHGTQFTLDEGNRVEVTITANSPFRSASDPDIFFDGRQYVIYISHGPSLSVWTSPTLKGVYAPVSSLPDGLLSQGSGGVGSGYFDAETGMYWTFAHASSPNAPAKILLAQHTDFLRPLNFPDWTAVLSGESLGLGDSFNVESPGFAVNAP